MKWGILIIISLWSATLSASHSFSGLDLCALYPERMPPGIEPALLPQPASRGAQLMRQYCTQCHNLPGPGRHTVDEWPAVMEQMNLLMDVSSRFGGLLGRVEAPSVEERDILQAYLLNNALQAATFQPQGLVGRAFKSQCATCHVLPNPAQHSAKEWPQVIKRMQRNMAIMEYPPLSREVLLQIQNYLQQHAGDTETDHVVATTQILSVMGNEGKIHSVNASAEGLARADTWLAVGPFLLLVAVGGFRWWRTTRIKRSLSVSVGPSGNG